MTKVIISEDCGNSAKNIFAQNLTIALARVDTKFILDSVADDIQWNIIGEKITQGKDDFASALERMRNNQAAELTINHVVTHGKAGAVNGTLKLKNGNIHAFCDVYEFSGAKGTSVKEITSYMIEIK